MAWVDASNANQWLTIAVKKNTHVYTVGTQIPEVGRFPLGSVVPANVLALCRIMEFDSRKCLRILKIFIELLHDRTAH